MQNYLPSKMKTPAAMARSARSMLGITGINAASPMRMSQIASSNMPIFFVKLIFIGLFLSSLLLNYQVGIITKLYAIDKKLKTETGVHRQGCEGARIKPSKVSSPADMITPSGPLISYDRTLYSQNALQGCLLFRRKFFNFINCFALVQVAALLCKPAPSCGTKQRPGAAFEF